MLITQHIEDKVYAVALSTHELFFQGDKMQWLKDNAEVLDWSDCPALHQRILADASGATQDEQKTPDNDKEPDDIPF